MTTWKEFAGFASLIICICGLLATPIVSHNMQTMYSRTVDVHTPMEHRTLRTYERWPREEDWKTWADELRAEFPGVHVECISDVRCNVVNVCLGETTCFGYGNHIVNGTDTRYHATCKVEIAGPRYQLVGQ